MNKLGRIVLPIIIILLLCTLSACGSKLSFQKTANKPSISYQDLEAYYLENYTEGSEPMLPEDAPLYKVFRDVLLFNDKAEVQASLNAVEQLLNSDVSGNYRNMASLLLLLGQYQENILQNDAKALQLYQRVWREYVATPFLHPYFDPKKKELTNEWYLLFSDAEAICKAGDLYLRTSRPKLALNCYKRVLRYYSDEQTGSYSYDFPDRYGRVVAAKLVKLEPVNMPEAEPERSYSSDRREEFTKLAETLPASLVRRDIDRFMGFISYAGVEIGYAAAEKKWTDHDAVVYQLQHKQGPQYEMLFGLMQSLKVQSDEVTVTTDRQGNDYEAVLSHAKSAQALHLRFRPIDTIWYITGIYLY